MSSSSIRPTTIIAASVGTVVFGFVAYAIYFDHRRRTDSDFRKALKRESKKQAKAQKIQAQADSANRMKEIKASVDIVNEGAMPTSPDEIEEFFMTELARGEQLCNDGELLPIRRRETLLLPTNSNFVPTESQQMEAAMAFFRALKVYPQKSELINIYDKTVPKVRTLYSSLCVRR
jgi:import receptor subunit TOM20